MVRRPPLTFTLASIVPRWRGGSMLSIALILFSIAHLLTKIRAFNTFSGNKKPSKVMF